MEEFEETVEEEGGDEIIADISVPNIRLNSNSNNVIHFSYDESS